MMHHSHSYKHGVKPTIQDKLREHTGQIVHLTHNDLDAAGSDAVVRMKYGDDILTIFSSVGKFSWFLGQISAYNGNNRILIISDLGYQNGIEDKIRKIRAAGWLIRWYDHHQWNADKEALIRNYADQLIVDTSRCATGVLVAALKPESPWATEVVKAVCDYDLGKHKYPQSDMLGIVTSGNANIHLVRDKLRQGIIIDAEIEKIYASLEQEKNDCIKKSIRYAKVFDGKYKTAVMPAYGYPNETAVVAQKKFGADIELMVFDSGKFSLRSKPEISHLIAKEFHGGGHPRSAGGILGYRLKEKILFKVFHKVSKTDEVLMVTEKY